METFITISLIFSDLQEAQMANDAEIYSRLLREKVSVKFNFTFGLQNML